MHEPAHMDLTRWKRELEEQRTQKNAFFASHPQSPLSPDARAYFLGLAYWPPDPDYRFELELHEHPEKIVREVQDTSGNTRPLLRWGEFRFEVGGRPCTLRGYKSDPVEDRLFLPFRDETSGQESYGAGRYLDLEPERDLGPSGLWIVDLNQAYNPWCAYSDAYVCPFVPPENWLPVAIRAGEKTFRQSA